jgi:chromosome segregation ATPase
MMSFAQNSQNAGSPVDRGKVVRRLLAEIDTKNELVEKLEAREQELNKEIAKADAAHAELTEAHKQALLELGEVRATIRFQKAGIEDHKRQVDLWKGEAEHAKKELKTSRKRELILTVALILRSLL